MYTSRLLSLTKWLSECLGCGQLKLSALGGDAGFRCYYRFSYRNVSYIAVDAEPKYSNNLGFIEIAKALHQQNINVPDVLYYDLAQGFLCIRDFGTLLFSDELNADTVKPLYQKAIKLLPQISTTKLSDNYQLPQYDKGFVETELSIFTDWLLIKHLSIVLSSNEKIRLAACFALLVDNVLEQPQVFMHRDYHSRNIMILENEELGVIDFQDAVFGPITYDIVSLLRDCYVRWPDELINNLFSYFCQQLPNSLFLQYSKEQWQRWFDLMGLQRHIKASGIFARLYHRDNKKNYLNDIPLTLGYIVDIAQTYPELTFLSTLVTEKVIPKLQQITVFSAKGFK